MTRRVAVVGGAGFIGSHLVERLVAAGDSVLVIDDISHPCGVELPASAELVEADGGSPEAARALERFRPEGLVHLAAKGGVNRALRDPGGPRPRGAGQLGGVLRQCRRRRVAGHW